MNCFQKHLDFWWHIFLFEAKEGESGGGDF